MPPTSNPRPRPTSPTPSDDDDTTHTAPPSSKRRLTVKLTVASQGAARFTPSDRTKWPFVRKWEKIPADFQSRSYAEAYPKGAGMVCDFPLPVEVKGERIVLMAGLYPPDEENCGTVFGCRTGVDLIAVMGGSRQFTIVDLFNFAPLGGAKSVKQGVMAELVHNNDPDTKRLAAEYFAKIESMIAASVMEPVLVWCGHIVNEVREQLEASGHLDPGTIRFTTIDCAVVDVTIAGRRMVSVVDAVHPSAHLVARGGEEARLRYKSVYSLVAALRHNPDLTQQEAESAIGADRAARLDALKRALDALRIDHHDGRVDISIRTLRHVPWGVEGVLGRVLELQRSLGQAVFLRICKTAAAAQLGRQEVVEGIGGLLTLLKNDPRLLSAFFCHGVAARLADPIFLMNVRSIFTTLLNSSPILLSRFMCNSVAKRLHDDSFLMNVRTIFTTLLNSSPILLSRFMCDSVAKRLHDDSFLMNVRSIFTTLLNSSPILLSRFMCNSVAKRLHDDSFLMNVRTIFTTLLNSSPILLSRFMCNSVAARLHDDSFLDKLHVLFVYVDSDPSYFARIMHVGVASRLTNPGFVGAIGSLVTSLDHNFDVVISLCHETILLDNLVNEGGVQCIADAYKSGLRGNGGRVVAVQRVINTCTKNGWGKMVNKRIVKKRVVMNL